MLYIAIYYALRIRYCCVILRCNFAFLAKKKKKVALTRGDLLLAFTISVSAVVQPSPLYLALVKFLGRERGEFSSIEYGFNNPVVVG